MTDHPKTRSTPRRAAALVAVLALAGVLGGCVVEPAGYWGYHHYYYHY